MYTIFFSDVEICYAKINVERYIQFKQEGSCTTLLDFGPEFRR